MLASKIKNIQNKIYKLLLITIELFCGSSLFFVNCLSLLVVLLLLIIIYFIYGTQYSSIFVSVLSSVLAAVLLNIFIIIDNRIASIKLIRNSLEILANTYNNLLGKIVFYRSTLLTYI